MEATIILSEHTELHAIAPMLETAGEFRLVNAAEKPVAQGGKVYLDLTFDFFNRETGTPYLYSHFARLGEMLESPGPEPANLTILRSYPFKANVRSFLMRQKILEQYIDILAAYYGARVLYIPTVISRHHLTASQNPCVSVINAVRMDTAERLRFREDSSFKLLYAIDLVHFMLADKDKPAGKNQLLDGTELTLKQVYESAARVTGQTPVTYDTRAFIQYEKPDISQDALDISNYTFDDMMIDLISYLR